MEITEVKLKLTESQKDRLLGFCSITIDDSFVIRDLKIIDTENGPFVAMPSKKIMEHCPTCGTKNHLRARFCNECAKYLGNSKHKQGKGRIYRKLHADIAHPINSECRELIQKKVLEAYKEEKAKPEDQREIMEDNQFD